jgi:hypothetical protein
MVNIKPKRGSGLNLKAHHNSPTRLKEQAQEHEKKRFYRRSLFSCGICSYKDRKKAQRY